MILEYMYYVVVGQKFLQKKESKQAVYQTCISNVPVFSLCVFVCLVGWFFVSVGIYC